MVCCDRPSKQYHSRWNHCARTGIASGISASGCITIFRTILDNYSVCDFAISVHGQTHKSELATHVAPAPTRECLFQHRVLPSVDKSLPRSDLTQSKTREISRLVRAQEHGETANARLPGPSPWAIPTCAVNAAYSLCGPAHKSRQGDPPRPPHTSRD